jgi:hypothetical protein
MTDGLQPDQPKQATGFPERRFLSVGYQTHPPNRDRMAVFPTDF